MVAVAVVPWPRLRANVPPVTRPAAQQSDAPFGPHVGLSPAQLGPSFDAPPVPGLPPVAAAPPAPDIPPAAEDAPPVPVTPPVPAPSAPSVPALPAAPSDRSCAFPPQPATKARTRPAQTRKRIDDMLSSRDRPRS